MGSWYEPLSLLKLSNLCASYNSLSWYLARLAIVPHLAEPAQVRRDQPTFRAADLDRLGDL